MNYIIIIIAILFSSISHANPYENLKTVQGISGEIQTGDEIQKYSYYGKDLKYVDKYLEIASKASIDMLENDYNLKKCKNINLEILDISMNEMNNRQVNTGPNWDGLQLNKIVGFYDSITVPGTGVIEIPNDVSKSLKAETIAHEIAHYWQDVYCFKNDYHKQFESFAIKIEDSIR